MNKILCVNVSDEGSTGKIIGDIAENSEKYRYIVCTPRGRMEKENVQAYALMSIPHEQGIYRRVSKLIGYPYGFAPLSTLKLIRIIQHEKPSLIHLHCMNSNVVNIYTLFHFLSAKRIPVVITNHAEFYYTGSCAHAMECLQWVHGCKKCGNLHDATDTLRDCTSSAWRKMKHALDGVEMITAVSVSPWEADRCRMSGIMEKIPQRMILNGVETAVFYPRKNVDLCSQLRNKKIVLHVTACFSDKKDELKGGCFILNLAQKYLGIDDVFFVVAGSVDKDIDRKKLPSNILLLENVRDQAELAKWYSAAAVTVITSRRETFCMPVAESLCCGTPVIGFESGGAESVALSEFSEFVQYGDEQALDGVLKKWINIKDDHVVEKCSTNAKKVYDSKIMARKYEMLYSELIVDGNCSK